MLHVLVSVFLIVFSSVYVADWSPCGKELLIRLTVCSLCIMSICYFGTVVLIDPVPGYYLPGTFKTLFNTKLNVLHENEMIRTCI